MPSPRVLDFNPGPRTEFTNLEKTLGGFTQRYRENEVNNQDNDALREIYGQYQKEGNKIEEAYMSLQNNKKLSPTARVEGTKNLLQMHKFNTELQKQAKEDAEKAEKKSNLSLIAQDLQEKRGLSPDLSQAYAANPSLIDKASPKEPKINQADRPVDPDQQQRIEKVISSPEWEKATIPQKRQLLLRGDVSNSNSDSLMNSIIEDAKINTQEEKTKNQAVDSAYKAQEKFINDTTNSYKAFVSDTKPKVLQMQKVASDQELISPTTNAFLETLGIPLGALDDPSSELYNKLSLDLLKGLPETYGNRILKVEVDNFLKTVPGLANSPEGRRMIASNILKLGEMKEVYYNEMRKQQREYLDNNIPLPRDFQQKVFDQVEPQINRINSDFVKLSEVKSVPSGTIPFFDPDGEIVFVPKEHAQWASENQGRRIW